MEELVSNMQDIIEEGSAARDLNIERDRAINLRDAMLEGRILGGKVICDAVLDHAKRLVKRGKKSEATIVFALHGRLLDTSVA